MMVHHQTPPTRHGSTQAHDSQEDPHALPQWLDIAVSGDGLGLGLALWPPTPASPVSSAAVPIPISTSTPSLSSSRSPSSSSSLASSASSSVATTPVIQDDHAVSPVDLAIPSPDRMPSVSVANGPMGRLAAHTSQSQGRSFFSSLRSRSGWTFGSSSPSSSTGSSPDLLANSFSAEHGRSISMPQLASSSEPRLSTDLSISRQSSRSPRSLAARTFATISRSASMRSIDRLEVSAVDPSLPTARAPTQPPKAATSAESAIPKLSAIGLTLNPITPNLSLARNAQPLCGAVLDGCYLLIGTTSGLDFLPLPEKGSLPVQHSGLKKRHETRKPLSLIKRTRFKQIVVLNERSNVLVAIAGRNDHVRVYPLDGIRAIIDKRMAEVDPLHGYPIPPAPSAKGKQRNDVPTSQPANLSANHFSAYQFPPSSEASEAGDSLPSSSTTSRPFASARGASTAPIRVSQRTGSAIAPVVRSVPTVQPKHGPVTGSSTQPREFIASRRTSTASIPRRPSRPDLGVVSPALSRRASLQSVNPRRSSAHAIVRRRSSVAPLTSLPAPTTSFPRLTPRTPLRPLSATEVSPTSSLAEFFSKTGPDTAPPELNKLISIPRRYSVDGDQSAPRAHFPLGRGMGEQPRLRRLSVTSAALFRPADLSAAENTQPRPLSPPAERYSPLTDSSGLPPASEPTRPRLLVARSPVVDEEEAAATSRALLETLNEEPPQSRSPEAAASRRRKRWTFNGAASSSAQSGSRGGTTPSPSRSTAVPSEDSTAGRSPPGLTRIEVVSVVPTYAPSRRRGSQQTLHHDFKRRSVASLRSISGANVKSPAERNAPAHPANVQSPLEYVKLARSRGARVLKAVETPRRTYLALVGGEEGDRVELFTGSKSISLSLNRTFVLPDTPRSIELQLQGDELVDIYLMYADTIFALEPSTVRVREVGVGREERRAQRQQDHHREEQERLLRESLSFGGSASDLQDGAAATIQPSQTHAFEGETAEVPDAEASSHPPTYAQPVGASASALRATVSTGANRDRRPVNDYSALQQLPLIPPVPSSILAPSWIIPPLYTDVVPDSDIAMHMGPTTDDAEPLLPPVSLLGGAALRNNGPPGLFFCSKGANASAIVTADGKSVTKTPLRWSGSHCTTRNDDDDDDGDAFARHRLELLVLSGKTTVVVKFAECGLEALPIVGGDDYPLPIEVPTRARSSVHFLASNAAGEQLFFAEVNSSSFTIKCLSGTS